MIKSEDYGLKCFMDGLKTENDISGRSAHALISLEMPAPGILTYMNGGLESF
jgi:hypothetical protein